MAPAVRQHPGAWPAPHGGTDMPNATRATASRQAVHDVLLETASTIAQNAEELSDYLEMLGRLRGDAQCEAAVTGLMVVPPVRILHLSWEIFVVLCDGAGINPLDLMDELGCTEDAYMVLDALYGIE